MEVLSDRAKEILRSKVMAHLALIASDGGPHTTPVWVDVDDGRLLVNTAEGRVKARALVEGAPVALSATDPGNPYEYVQIRGRVVQRRTDGADADIDRLAEKYLGADSYPFRQPGEQRVTLVIEPEQVTGV